MIADEILALEADRRRALVAGDVDALALILDEEAVYYPGAGGRQSAAATLDSIRNATVRYLDVQMMEEDVIVFGDTAVVTGLLVMHVVVAGEEMVNRRRFVDIWIRRRGGWRLVLYYGIMVEASPAEIQAEIAAGVRRALAAAEPPTT